MKRLIVLSLCAAAMVVAAGCGSNDPMEGAPENTESMPLAPNQGEAPGTIDPKTGQAEQAPQSMGLPGGKGSR
jgi:hypothetical protein